MSIVIPPTIFPGDGGLYGPGTTTDGLGSFPPGLPVVNLFGSSVIFTFDCACIA